jgi:hypothetical protein
MPRMMDIDEFEDYLELQDAAVQRHIKKSNQEYLAGKSRPARDLLDELRKEANKKVRKRRQK